MDQQSDTELERIAKDLPAGLTASNIAGIIAGVLAGPGDDGRMGGEADWMQLISENLDDKQQKQLTALKSSWSDFLIHVVKLHKAEGVVH